MSIQWWRSWHGAPMDPKWAVIGERSGGVKVGIVSAVAWALMDYASQNKERGSIEGFDTETYAVFSGFEETIVVAVIKAMQEKGIITNNHFINWEKRQPQREDDSYERVTKWREEKRNVTQRNSKICTDKDKDKEKKEGAKAPDKLNVPVFLDAWKEWLIYRKEIKHPLTERTAIKQLKDLEKYTPEVAAAMINQAILKGWQGFFPLKDNNQDGDTHVETFVGKAPDGGIYV